MIKKLWKENKGFTLIEIVITTVVLATISIPLLAYFSESMRHSARTKQQQNAVVAAQDAVEELKNASFSLDNDKVADPSAAPKASWTVASPLPSAPAAYDMYKNYTVNGSSYNVVAHVTPKKSVNNVYNGSNGLYDRNLSYSKAIIPSMDSNKDLISTETAQYLSDAKLYYGGLYSTYCKDNKNTIVKDTTKVNTTTIGNHLKRKIVVGIKPGASTGKIIATVTYEYSYVKDASDEYPDAILTAHPDPYKVDIAKQSIDADKFENIFIFYKPDMKNDEVEIKGSTLASTLGVANMKLYLVAENSVANSLATPGDHSDPDIIVRDMTYSMKVSTDTNLTGTVTKAYTNLCASGHDEIASSGNVSTVMQKDGSGNYTLITTEDSNRLVDITVSVYKDKGGSYPFDESDKLASVDGNKVQ